MRKSVSRFFLLGALVFGLSLALQAEDLPETPYDESQEQACENFPLFSIQLLQDSIQTTQPVQESVSPISLGFLTSHDEAFVGMSEGSAQSISVGLTVFSLPLRC